MRGFSVLLWPVPIATWVQVSSVVTLLSLVVLVVRPHTFGSSPSIVKSGSLESCDIHCVRQGVATGDMMCGCVLNRLTCIYCWLGPFVLPDLLRNQCFYRLEDSPRKGFNAHHGPQK